MSDVQRDLEPSGLIAAIEGNTIENIRAWTRWSKLSLHEDPNGIWTSSDIPYFIFNMVLNVGPSDAPSTVIDAVISQAKERQVPVAWWVGPSNSSPDLSKALEDEGLFQVAELTGMAVGLHDLDENVSLPESLTITKVEDNDALTTWCQIMAEVSEFPDFASSAWLEMFQEIGVLDDPLWHLYLGSIEGTPMATSELFLGGGVAGIHGVTTVPKYRGKGIGTAMTLLPLVDARRDGYEIGVLFSSEMAVGIYRNLGFEEYGKGYIYLWQES